MYTHKTARFLSHATLMAPHQQKGHYNRFTQKARQTAHTCSCKWKLCKYLYSQCN